MALRVITTHLHADFDCVASMLAAKKLYPNAVLVFPGSQEKNVRDYLADTDLAFSWRRLRGLNMDEISEVIIVDASTRERIGVFAKLAEKKDVSFRIYDHHPSAKIDLPYESAIVRERGATVTIFVEIFREKGIDINPGEATLMALGLYEDTGGLTFSSVRPEDFQAASWLLEKGADLNIVSDYMRRELNAAQIDLLNTLLKNLEIRQVRGVPVALATASTSRYVGDIANIAHKIMDIESLDVLFTLVRMNDRTHLVARSRIEAVNAGLVAEKLGGGGHPNAASATIKDFTLPQAVDRLWQGLEEIIEPPPDAEDMMIEKVVTTSSGTSIEKAEEIMTRYDINGMPVMDDDRVVGLITRQIVEKAIHHGMASQKVSDFMINEFATVNPDTPAYILEDIVLGRRQKQIPVVDRESGLLVGIVSRGMVLSKIYGDSLKKHPTNVIQGRSSRSPITRNISGIMRERLDKRILRLFHLVEDVANKNGYTAYVAGGFVRDLLLRIENTDVDIVIEGDGIDFARKLAARLDGRVRAHEKFKTAVVVAPDGFKIDVATARIEYYAHPAALPTVEMSALRHDLYRRDFSINAMAIRINGAKPNTLVDFFGGQADLKDHVIRVLHNLSFVEDPTRAFRAVRFERRYGFTMGKQTLSLLQSAVRNQLFNRLSGGRLFSELKLILEERRPAAAVARMKELGLLRFIHPDLDFDDRVAALMDNCEDLLAWRELTFPDEPVEEWLVRFMAMVSPLKNDKVEEMAGKFPTQRKTVMKALEARELIEKAIERLGYSFKAPDSEIFEALRPIPDEALLYMAARTQDRKARNAITRYMAEIKDVKPFVTGDDLIKLGAPSSPTIGEVLKKTMAAQLDHEVKDRKEALAYAMGLLEEKT